MKELFKKEKLFITVFGLGMIIFLWDVLLLKNLFIYGDYKQQFFPWFMEYAKAVRHLSLPFWVPGIACGFPLVAEGQIGAFYPLNLAMFYLLPPIAAYSYGTILHFMLGGIFMYIYCREIGLKDIAAVIPPVLFMFASPYAGCFSNIASLKVLCWFPLVLYIINVSLRKGRPYLLVYSGIITGFQLLAGAPQMAAYSILFSFLYLLFFLFKDKKDNIWGYMTAFMLSCFLALVIASPQILATRQLVSLSNRSARDFNFAIARSFFPAGILTAVFPYTCAIFEGVMIYIGILPLIFAFISIFCVKKNKYTLFFITLLLLSMLCAFGRYNPLYTAFLKLSHFYLFRIPSKFLFFSAFSLIVLSGFGIQSFLTGMDEAARKRIKIISLAFFSLALVSLLMADFSLKAWKDQILGIVKNYVITGVYDPTLHKYPIEHYLEKVNALYYSALDALSISNKYIYGQIMIIAASLVMFFSFKGKGAGKNNFKVPFLVIIFLDLIFFSFVGAGFRGNIAKLSDVVRDTPEIGILKKDSSLFRVYLFKAEEAGNVLQPNMNLYFNIDGIGVYSPLIYKRYVRLLGELGCVDDSTGVSVTSKDILYKNLAILSMLNVKYIISPEDISSGEIKFIKDVEDGNRVYLNKAAMPRAFIVHKARMMNDEEGILAYMKSSGFDPSRTAIVEDDIPQSLMDGYSDSGNSAADIKEYSPRRISIKTRSGSDGLLVLSDYYYPGWKAYLDGKPVKILRANYIIRAILLPKGEHEIEFIY